MKKLAKAKAPQLAGLLYLTMRRAYFSNMA